MISNIAISLLVIGAALMIAEAILPAMGMLAIMGLAAFAYGVALLIKAPALPEFMADPALAGGATLFGVIVLIGALYFVWRARQLKTTTGAESLIGANAKVLEWNGKEGRVHVQGESWRAVSDAAMTLQPGESVTVAAMNDLTLTIKP